MKILFQGDSITDANRVRDNYADAGKGYALLVKASLGFERPGEYEFINRGLSYSRIAEVYARMEKDIINIKPDVMSILIGVNDVWAEYGEEPFGINADKYYKIYDMLIEEVKTALPDIKIIIMEPFVLRGSATDANWDCFRSEVEKRAEMAKRISEKYNLPYIQLQQGFDELSETTGPDYWLKDGVHPTPMGHEYIKNEWIKKFKALGL